jgi:hypothetical protein
MFGRDRGSHSGSVLFTFVVIVGVGFLPGAATAIKVTNFAATLHGFPTLRDSTGKKLADGDFAQWLEGERLHVKLGYRFSNNRHIQEKAEFRQKPELIQENWSWREFKDGKLFRNFAANLVSGQATAEKQENNESKRWSAKLDIELGQIFAGIGFVLAVMNLRERLVAGEKIELNAVAFTPKPRSVSVEIAHAGVDQMRMADRQLKGNHFVIHPKIPRILRIFVAAPDTHLWLINPVPAAFLRMEGPLVEPTDPIIRIDLLSGGESGLAKPFSEKN